MAKMDNDIIQAYLWHDIVRLGFSPSGKKDIKSWLCMYGESLKDFWQVDEYPPHPSQTNGVLAIQLTSSIQMSMLIDCSIIDVSNYAVRFLHINNKRELMWTHEADSKYFTFPEQPFLTKYNLRNDSIRKMSTVDMERVINSLLLHPRVHQHIESPINNHDIRIGGGIINPFVFLFHLRYQLCPDKKRRDEEKGRLIRLFEPAVKNDREIKVNELMKG